MLLDEILKCRGPGEQGPRSIAIIGMAKNAGKTVVLNQIIKEASEKQIPLAVLSYGRDGEQRDVLTRKPKPSITLPKGTIFATTHRLWKLSGIPAVILKESRWNTVLGKVLLLQSTEDAGENTIELAGLNKSAQIQEMKHSIDSELMLIDGALDRRSSAMPAIADGFILATGAVLSADAEIVCDKTISALERLLLPECTPGEIPGYCAYMVQDHQQLDQWIDCRNSFGMADIQKCIDEWKKNPGGRLTIPGAFSDGMAEKLLRGIEKGVEIIVQDGTKLFLDDRHFTLLWKKGFRITSQKSMKLLAVTVNPYSPYLEQEVPSEKLRDLLKEKLKNRFPELNIPVVNVRSESYFRNQR
jgi:hypothetical protein